MRPAQAADCRLIHSARRFIQNPADMSKNLASRSAVLGVTPREAGYATLRRLQQSLASTDSMSYEVASTLGGRSVGTQRAMGHSDILVSPSEKPKRGVGVT